MARRRKKTRKKTKRKRERGPSRVKKSTGKKGRPREIEKGWSKRTATLTAVVVSAVGLFLGLCVFLPGSSGFVGRGVGDVLANLVGVGRFFLPFVLIGFGILLIIRREQNIGLSMVAGAFILFWAVMAMIHVPLGTASMLSLEEVSSGGGYMGAVLAWPLAKAFGDIGAYIFLGAALLVGAILVGEEQIAKIWRKAKDSLERKRERPAEVSPEKDVGKAKEKRAAKEEPVTFPGPPMPQSIGVEKGGTGQLAIKLKQQDKGPYKLPPTSILKKTVEKARFSKKSVEEKAKTIEKTLLSFDVNAKVARIDRGPTVTIFEI